MRIGVIDIGYNAIRAVAYESNDPESVEIYGNKFKNDILSLLTSDDIDTRHQTYLYLSHILTIFKNLGVKQFRCVATAVLRNHSKSEEFTKLVKKKFDFEIEIISGDTEARLTAQGLLLGITEADGIAIDLGGGSLEIADVKDKKIYDISSHELGTGVIDHQLKENDHLISDIVEKHYNKRKYHNLYFIGGALRYLCRSYIDYAKYPIKTLHNLVIDTTDFIQFLAFFEEKHLRNKINKKKTSYNALMIVRDVIKNFTPTRLIVSTYGLKEGVKLEMLNINEIPDNIVETKLLKIYGKTQCNFTLDHFIEILSNLIGNSEAYKYIIFYSLIILDDYKNFDQTIFPQALIEYILSSEIQFTHDERVKISLVIAYIAMFKVSNTIIEIAKKIITRKEHVICQAIGNLIKIFIQVDGYCSNTPSFTIVNKGGYLEIDTDRILPRPIFEKVRERLKNTAFAIKQVKLMNHYQ